MEAYYRSWKHRNADEWVHLFIHTLDTLPKSWYTDTEFAKALRLGLC